MIEELLKKIACISIYGCCALLFTKKTALHEVMRLAVGMILLCILIDAAAVRFPLAVGLLPQRSNLRMETEIQKTAYRRALCDAASEKAEEYFSSRGQSAEAEIAWNGNKEPSVIIRTQAEYEWTEEDKEAFTAWSGITKENQTWISAKHGAES